MYTVLQRISALTLLFVLLVHMCGDSLLSVRIRSAPTAHIMGDVAVAVAWNEWWKLHNELERIREDTGKVNSFMTKHVNTKWKV
jgi:hypothetical protein